MMMEREVRFGLSFLEILEKFFREGPFHPVNTKKLTPGEKANWRKLRYWILIEPVGDAGEWGVTDYGKEVLGWKVPIREIAVLRDEEVIRLEGDYLWVDQVVERGGGTWHPEVARFDPRAACIPFGRGGW